MSVEVVANATAVEVGSRDTGRVEFLAESYADFVAATGAGTGAAEIDAGGESKWAGGAEAEAVVASSTTGR